MRIKHPFKNNGQLRKAVLKNAVENHLWINAITLVRPTEKTLAAIGCQVVSMLKREENLLPAYHGETDGSKISDLQNRTPVLYLSINQS